MFSASEPTKSFWLPLTKIAEGSEKDNDLAAFGKGSVMASESNSRSGRNALTSREVRTNAGVSFFRTFHSTLALYMFSHNRLNSTSILL